MADTIALMKKRVLNMAIRGELVDQHLEEGTAQELILRTPEVGILSKIQEDNSNLLYNIPKNWEWVKVKDIGLTRGGDGFPLNMQNKNEGKYPLFKVGDLSKVTGNYAVNSEYWLDEEDFKIKNFFVFPANTIAFPKIGAALLLNNRKILQQKSLLDNNCMGLIPNMRVNHEYLFYFLKTIDLGMLSKGTSIPSVSQSQINNIDFPLPPLSEQRRIVAIIEEIFTVIDQIGIRKEESLAIIENIRQTSLQNAIMGQLVKQNENNERASELYEKIKNEKENLIKLGKIKKEKQLPEIEPEDVPFEIPESWKWVRLGEIISLISGRDLATKDFNVTEQGLPYITGASNFNLGRLTVSRWTENPKVISKCGDLLITVKGTIGDMHFQEIEEAHIARQVMAIRNVSEISLKYIMSTE